MLGKLMKYEWQATWKLLLPANLLIIVMTFFGCMAVRLNLGDIDNDGIMFGAVMILVTYVGSMFVVMIGTAIFLIYRFYTSTYGDQGSSFSFHYVMARTAVRHLPNHWNTFQS